MNIPIIFFCAVVNNGVIYWQDERLYRTEEGAKRRRKKLLKDHPKGLVVLYADDFKIA